MSERASVSRHSSEGEEDEVFEITDFTNVSDWEKFIAQITDAISVWQLTCIEHVRPLRKNELTNGTWEQSSKEIRFANAVFLLMLYRLKQEEGEEIFLDQEDSKVDDELKLPLYMDDMMSGTNDFPPRAHCLSRWYGFRSFLVISLISSGSKTVMGLTSESKCNLLLSSACMVLSDSGCEVPIFIQIQENWRKMFTGRCIGTGMQTAFDMVHLKKCPPQYQHLSGLLHIFKTKIGPDVPPVQISARFTYVMSNWGGRGVWPKDNINPGDAALKFDQFLFGALEDPIGDLHLSAIWPSVTEDLIVENDVHSDFYPQNAPLWTVRLHYTDNPECLLSNYLSELLKIRYCKDSIDELISTVVNPQNETQDMGHALEKLTDSSHRVRQIVPLVPELTSGIVKYVSNRKSIWQSRVQITTDGPISQSVLGKIMEFLFADKEEANDEEDDTNFQDLEHQMKSASKNSLTYRLATCVTVANFCHGGAAAVAQLWHEFVQEMRFRFENGILISGIKKKNPDLRCCLLHQKLQMLNCCIQHKISREMQQENRAKELGDNVQNKDLLPDEDQENVNEDQNDISAISTQNFPKESHDEQEGSSHDESPPGDQPRQESAEAYAKTPHLDSDPPVSPSWTDEVSSMDDDEFFECDDGESDKNLPTDEDSIRAETEQTQVIKSDVIPESVTEDVVESSIRQEELMDQSAIADGRLKPFESVKLLKFNDLLYIPITQEPTPLTEDALDEQTKIFSSLGDSAEGAILRRKMQSATLLSDMESFKAANPNCCLEDFVRWYSPRDFEVSPVDGEGSGTLSERMKLPGNLWQTMWEAARSVPARRQKRLFDDTKEGEKVLHFLVSLHPKDLVLHLLPMSFHEAISILRTRGSSNVPSIPNLIKQIEAQASKLFRSQYLDKWSQIDDLMQKILFTETMIERVSALKHKFAKIKDCDNFVKKLVEHPEVVVEGAAQGAVGKIIKEYFNAQLLATQSPQVEGYEAPKQNTLPPPCGREYILRTAAPRPSPQSRTLPHRMYAVLMKNEFRLAGAFSSDTVFF